MKKRLCIPLAFILTAVAVLCGYTSLISDTSPSPPLSVSVSTAQSNENTVTVKASVLPSDNTALVDWSLSWVNPSSIWASTKTVTDYVTVTPLSNGSQTAKVNCLQAFGEQVQVCVTTRANTTIKGYCTVDYRQKLEGCSLQVRKNITGLDLLYELMNNEIHTFDYNDLINNSMVCQYFFNITGYGIGSIPFTADKAELFYSKYDEQFLAAAKTTIDFDYYEPDTLPSNAGINGLFNPGSAYQIRNWASFIQTSVLNYVTAREGNPSFSEYMPIFKSFLEGYSGRVQIITVNIYSDNNKICTFQYGVNYYKSVYAVSVDLPSIIFGGN